MATTRSTATAPPVDDIDTWIKQDPGEPGRHNARFVDYGTHVWAVLNTWRRTNDVAETAAEWDLPEQAIRAALRYYEQHRALFDAYFLLQDEEYNAWCDS